MKKIYLKNALSLALILSAGIANSQTFLPKQAKISYQDSPLITLVDYSYNNSGLLLREDRYAIIPGFSDTTLSSYKTYVRDNLGRILEEAVYAPNSTTNNFSIQHKNTYVFNPDNKSLDQSDADVQKEYNYNSSTSALVLTNADSTVKTFSNGKLTKEQGYRINNPGKQFLLSYEEAFTYNIQGLVASRSSIDYSEGVVKEGEKLEFDYINSQVKEYMLSNNTWIPTIIYKNIVFENGTPVSPDGDINIQQYTGYKLNPDGSETSTIVAKETAPIQSGDTSIVERWETVDSILVKEREKTLKNDTSTVRINETLFNTTWEVTNVDTEYFDKKGNYAGYTNDTIMNGEIVHYNGNYQKRVFGGNGALLSETTYSFNNGEMTQSQMIAYSNFTPFVTAAENPKATVLNFWPNPAKDFLTLSEASDFVIFDFNGTVLQSGKASLSIDISSLNPSMYFIKAGNAAPVKFVKE